MPKLKLNTDLCIGLFGVIAGCLIVFVWVPMDVETGLIEKVRSQVVIGDAMAPSLAATILILGGLLTVFQSFRSQGSSDLTLKSLQFLVLLLVLLGLSLAVMRWAGPLVAQLFQTDYRSLRDTVPWKHIGYFWGGIVMIFGLVSFMEHRLRWRMLIVSIIAVLVMILIYDLPFKHLLLPPNGDL